ncbi:5-formyltetrahydrofolate cyclo-ligase [Mycotypha africana]|uniref:5-formyltetrahydrofolate cyclo-ligase n=1 Tax=Mycotypha africana TaxID=64632 RepID=UPI002301F397|nr:5-formyltetrahydrofolate cyclo-ligase [Mycotypha africana]KAI8979842.1 5-formyltetrahydrofolate cyclo-ligase [Mycotypha africana]
MNSTIVTLKKQLRKEMAIKLSKLPNNELNRQSDLVFQKLKQMKEFQSSKNISVYISMPTCEILTNKIIHDILASDKNCFIPRCTKTTMDMVKISSMDDFNSLPTNKWNIPEPPLDEPRENALDMEKGSGLDLILMPGVAFDKEKNRIGHGKGYYDRFIKECAKWSKEHGAPRAKTVALSLNEQIVDSGVIPTEETDEKLDYILTPESVFH